MNNTALAIIQPDELETIQRTAKLLAASGYFGTSQDGIVGMAQVAAKILAGRELGFGPFASVNGIHIISGKPTVGANLMAAAVRAHPRYDYRVKQLSETVCELEFFDGGKLAGISRFTAEDAAAAELSTGKNAGTWKKFARNMLFARAISNGVRWYAPDIFSGNAVYVPEELGAEVDGDGDVIEATPRIVESRIAERPERVEVESNGDVLFGKDAPKESPPHQRVFGQGLSVFGPAWNNGARKWLLEKWTSKATPDNVRNSLTELNDDEKDALADYIKENAAKLQSIWNNHESGKAAKQETVDKAA